MECWGANGDGETGDKSSAKGKDVTRLPWGWGWHQMALKKGFLVRRDPCQALSAALWTRTHAQYLFPFTRICMDTLPIWARADV